MHRFPRLLALLVSAPLAAQAPPTWELVGTSGFSDGAGICCQIELAPDGTPWVAFQDQSVPSIRCSVMRFQGGAWSYAGGKANASNGQAWYNSLAFDGTGRPYLACRDYASSGRISVRSFEGATNLWSNVGPSGSSAGEAHYTDIVIAPDGSPTVVFADRTTAPADRATALAFGNGNWHELGLAGFSPSGAAYTTLDVDAQGQIYAAFADSGVPDPLTSVGKASVMRFDADTGAWVSVGTRGFSPHGALNLTLAVDGQGTPWIAYYRWHSAIFVMRFDGSAWQAVGGSATGGDAPEIQTEGWRQWLSLDFDSQNTPYVAYQRFADANRAAVRRWNGSAWVPVGNLGFSPGAADYLSMAIGPDDVPYVVFRNAAMGQRVTVMRYAPSPHSYCTGVVSSQGCTPAITVLGELSLSGTEPVWITATNVVSHRSGLLLYSAGPDQVLFLGGSICLQVPLHRAGTSNSGGTPGVTDCSGVLQYDFGPRLRAGQPLFFAGARVFAQYYYRDLQNPNGPGLSDGVRFEIVP